MNEVTVADEGHTLIVNGSWRGGFEVTRCYFDELETPESIRALMHDSGDLPGSHEDEFDGIKYVWAYHEDDGVHYVTED